MDIDKTQGWTLDRIQTRTGYRHGQETDKDMMQTCTGYRHAQDTDKDR